MQHLTPCRSLFHVTGILHILTDWLRNHLRLSGCSDEIPSPTAYCQECCCCCLASERVPRGMTDECYYTKRQKADQAILHAGTQTGTDLLGHWIEFPAVTVWYNILDKQKFYIPCCSKQGHPVVRAEDGGDSFPWAVILADYRDSQVITKYPTTCTSPLAASHFCHSRFQNLMAFTNNETCSSTLLEDTSSPTYQWKKERIGQ